jgi:hypothetical protein
MRLRQRRVERRERSRIDPLRLQENIRTDPGVEHLLGDEGAHRLATIRNADRIFVFDAGEIVEQGSFDELVAKSGRFAALARTQFMAAEEAPKKIDDASESRFV